jgi:phenylalanyl-tRNA synthetase beta subunit
MKVKDIIQQLEGFSTEDLRKLSGAVVSVLKNKLRFARMAAGVQFKPGSTATFYSPKYGEDISIVVDKVTPSGVVYGKTHAGNKWKVSASLCTKEKTK